MRGSLRINRIETSRSSGAKLTVFFVFSRSLTKECSPVTDEVFEEDLSAENGGEERSDFADERRSLVSPPEDLGNDADEEDEEDEEADEEEEAKEAEEEELRAAFEPGDAAEGALAVRL